MSNEIETAQTSALVVAPNVSGAVNAMQQFQLLKTRLLDANDTVQINGNLYIKRSGWRKIALAFNVTTDILRTFPIKSADNEIVGYTVEAKATAPNGRYSIDQASCEFNEIERMLRTYHNVITRATTRALNRCISDLCGGGEVSAEEIIEGADSVAARPESSDSITEKQKDFMANLANKAFGHAVGAAQLVNIITTLRQQGKIRHDMQAELTKDEAAAVIDYLKSLPPHQ